MARHFAPSQSSIVFAGSVVIAPTGKSPSVFGTGALRLSQRCFQSRARLAMASTAFLGPDRPFRSERDGAPCAFPENPSGLSPYGVSRTPVPTQPVYAHHHECACKETPADSEQALHRKAASSPLVAGDHRASTRGPPLRRGSVLHVHIVTGNGRVLQAAARRVVPTGLCLVL
jgi:hypothetical protein